MRIKKRVNADSFCVGIAPDIYRIEQGTLPRLLLF